MSGKSHGLSPLHKNEVHPPYGHTTMAMPDMSTYTPPPPEPTRAKIDAYFFFLYARPRPLPAPAPASRRDLTRTHARSCCLRLLRTRTPGTSTAVTHSGASKHRKPAVTPSGKKPLTGAAATPTSSHQAHKSSSRAAPTSESRQPLSKHPITPKPKVPPRTVAAGAAAGAAGAAVPGRPTPTPKAQIQTGRGGFLSPTMASQSRSRSPRPKAEDARSARLVEEPGVGEEEVAAGPVLPPR